MNDSCSMPTENLYLLQQYKVCDFHYPKFVFIILRACNDLHFCHVCKNLQLLQLHFFQLIMSFFARYYALYVTISAIQGLMSGELEMYLTDIRGKFSGDKVAPNTGEPESELYSTSWRNYKRLWPFRHIRLHIIDDVTIQHYV